MFNVNKKTIFRVLALFTLTILLSIQVIPALSQNVENIQNYVDLQQIIEQGELDYYNGNYSEAELNFARIRDYFVNQGDNKNLAVALVRLSRVQLALGKTTEAIESLEQATAIYQNLENESEVSNSLIFLAKAWYQQGSYLQACNILTQPQALNIDNIYHPTEQETTAGICQDDNLTEEEAEEFIDVSYYQQSPHLKDVEGLIFLGKVLRVLGKLNESKIILEETESLVDDKFGKNEKLVKAATKLSLGNTLRAMANLERDRQADPKYDYMPWRCDVTPISEESELKYEEALKKYEEVEGLLSDPQKQLQIKTQLNRLSLLLEIKRASEAEQLYNQINFDNLPENQWLVFAKINKAKSMACLEKQEHQEQHSWTKIIELVEESIEDALAINNNRSASYAIGNLGGVYEYLATLDLEEYPATSNEICKEYVELGTKAQCLTQKALYSAQPTQDYDIAYQWQWQMGRLLTSEGKREEAIAAYETAAKSLESVRNDLRAINSDVRFNFRDNVEPVYRGLVKLLTETELEESQDKLWKSLYYLESLQLAELENFLQCNPSSLRIAQRQSVDNGETTSLELLKESFQELRQYDNEAALIYPILLDQRLEIIFSLPGKPLQRVTISDVSREEVEETVEKMREQIVSPLYDDKVRQPLQELYIWIIQPIEEELKIHNQVKTLVFVLDSFLQNIPLATLYDGQEYLIEKYAIAVIPSLQLLDPKPVVRQTSVLVAGATFEDEKFQGRVYPLPHVDDELKEISEIVNNSKKLSNSEFLQTNIQNEISSFPFSIVHIATHGKFSSNPENTYILDWDERIQVNDLENLITPEIQSEFEPIELFVLSACETATGDKRAALGLSGIAIRANARSTLASLWQVNDVSTAELMTQFYEQLKDPKVSKAEALQKTQLCLLQEKNCADRKDTTTYPKSYYWAGFVIVGNWL